MALPALVYPAALGTAMVHSVHLLWAAVIDPQMEASFELNLSVMEYSSHKTSIELTWEGWETHKNHKRPD